MLDMSMMRSSDNVTPVLRSLHERVRMLERKNSRLAAHGDVDSDGSFSVVVLDNEERKLYTFSSVPANLKHKVMEMIHEGVETRNAHIENLRKDRERENSKARRSRQHQGREASPDDEFVYGDHHDPSLVVDGKKYKLPFRDWVDVTHSLFSSGVHGTIDYKPKYAL